MKRQILCVTCGSELKWYEETVIERVVVCEDATMVMECQGRATVLPPPFSVQS